MATPALDPDPSQCRATDQTSCASMETRKYPEGAAGLRDSAQPGTNGTWGRRESGKGGCVTAPVAPELQPQRLIVLGHSSPVQAMSHNVHVGAC